VTVTSVQKKGQAVAVLRRGRINKRQRKIVTKIKSDNGSAKGGGSFYCTAEKQGTKG
jgi:hypothetical protein